jgi:hypothetical protein
VTGKRSNSSQKRNSPRKGRLHLIAMKQGSNLLELFQPGSFVRLKNQPNDLPPFQLISCKGGSCFVRQQTWGQYIHWEVEHHRLKSA